MIPSLRLLLPALVVASVFSACSHTKEQVARDAAPAPAAGGALCEAPGDTVVATYGDGAKVTLAEVRDQVSDQLVELDKQRHQLIERTVEGMVIERLVKEAAKQRGISEDELLKAEIDQKVPAPPDDQIRQLYEGAKDRLPEGATFEDVKPQIVEFLTSEQKQKRAREFFDDLKRNANVKVTLPQPPKKEAKRVEVAATGPSRGPADAPVTIVEFSDFECPFCGRGARTLDEVAQKYGDKVRVVFRNFPLSFHPNAQKAAEAALCAEEQGKFWQMHDLLFANQQALEVPQLKGYAKELGLDLAAFEKCLDSGTKAAQVKADLEAGTQAGVSGTPAFFINGVMLEGAQPAEEFEAVIDAELSRAP